MSEKSVNYVWIAVLAAIAILVGALSVAPQLLIKKSVEANGRTFVLNQFLHLHDGGDGYFQFAREVADGHFPPSDLSSDEDPPSIYPPLPPLILGILISFFGGITGGYLAALFFIPPLLFLLFYWIGTIIFDKNRLWSVFFALIGIFTPFSFATTEAFWSLSNLANIVLKNFYPVVQTLLPLPFYSRVDYPLLTSLIYLLAIGSFLVFWRRPGLKQGIFAGSIAGLLFYTYFHSWVYWVTVLGLTFLYSWIFLRKSDWLRVKNFCWLMMTTAIASVPYFINYFSLKSLPGGADLINRIGMEVGRNFQWQSWREYLVYASVVVLVYWIIWRRPERRTRAAFYLCVLAAAFVIWNIQIVVGYVPHSDHWPRAINPILFVIIFDLLYSVIQDWRHPKKIKMVFAVTLVLISLLVVKKIVNIAHFVSPGPEILKEYVLPEDILFAYRWMEQNLDEPKVVSSSLLTSIYISAFSSARPFLPIGVISSMTDYELEDHYLIANKLFDVAPETLEARLRDGAGIICKFECGQIYTKSNIEDTRYYLYGLAFVDPINPKIRKIPEEKIRELLVRYRNLKPSWQTVEVDYVFIGPWERQFSDPMLFRMQNMELVYRNKMAEIYKIKK